MNRIRLWAGIAAVVAACAVTCGCASQGQYPNLPDNSGPLRPASECSPPTNANSYLELNVFDPGQVTTTGQAWVFTTDGWVSTSLLSIKLVKIDAHHSLLSWSADASVDWMNGAYQGRSGSGQINSLNPDDLRDQHFTEQVVVHPVAGQRYATYASLPSGSVSHQSCMAPDGLHPFLPL